MLLRLGCGASVLLLSLPVLAEGGTIAMPYAATFWSEGFGMVTDRFATPWMVNVSDSTNTELS